MPCLVYSYVFIYDFIELIFAKSVVIYPSGAVPSSGTNLDELTVNNNKLLEVYEINISNTSYKNPLTVDVCKDSEIFTSPVISQ